MVVEENIALMKPVLGARRTTSGEVVFRIFFPNT
ncbi:MAG: hypothetical protein UX10_C0002G0024 [Candidatus Magasanikbacteria bacterium GW2011_GWA2_45_39]|uniref:Uncharacterized protein n=2 Tax=Candidatus Magasanikiibacteriota TaxID=1752731 RepID=A0A0G1MZ72_9BACT|nr:MAG: hypothetical protein UX10_C0002G0024 [Candidatus Magasanikbacteria bacterium GW2011_GWA2_45_39]KKU13656.1 MAG: hypothetical protein UX20_C0016G0004 [Candidatus Magasanikbacteria bacterium GW2011_GWC2_45_8]